MDVRRGKGAIRVEHSFLVAAAHIGALAARRANRIDLSLGFPRRRAAARIARFRGGLNAADFVKLISVQRLTKRGLNSIGRTVTTLARSEGLEAHARSIETRTGN